MRIGARPLREAGGGRGRDPRRGVPERCARSGRGGRPAPARSSRSTSRPRSVRGWLRAAGGDGDAPVATRRIRSSSRAAPRTCTRSGWRRSPCVLARRGWPCRVLGAMTPGRRAARLGPGGAGGGGGGDRRSAASRAGAAIESIAAVDAVPGVAGLLRGRRVRRGVGAPRRARHVPRGGRRSRPPGCVESALAAERCGAAGDASTRGIGTIGSG